MTDKISTLGSVFPTGPRPPVDLRSWHVLLDDGAALLWLTPGRRWSDARADAAAFETHAAAWSAADRAAGRLPDGVIGEPVVIAADAPPPPRRVIRFTPARLASARRFEPPTDAQQRGVVVFLSQPPAMCIVCGPDLRGKETAAAACRMLRAGVDPERALRNLLDVNERRPEPLDAEEVRRILDWALRETSRRGRPAGRRRRPVERGKRPA